MTTFPPGIHRGMGAQEALGFTVAFLDTKPDDDTLCSAALTIGEPLIDWHWQEVLEDFVAILAARRELRKMVACCDFDDSVPAHIRERIYASAGEGDDIDDGPTSDSQ